MAWRAGTTAGPSGGWRAATESWSSWLPGATGAGAASESGGDNAAGIAKFNPTNTLLQYGVDPSTLSTAPESLGSQLSGTPTTADRFFLPSMYDDGGTPRSIDWEVDSNGNATGRITNMAGSGNATNLPYRYWNGVALLSAVFSTQGSALTRVASGAASENGGDTTTGAANVRVGGSGAAIETGGDSAAGASSVTTRASGNPAEAGGDSASGAGNVTIGLTGTTQEPADSAVGGAAVKITGSGGPAESDSDTASGVASPGTIAAGAATEQGPDTAGGNARANVTAFGTTAEESGDSSSGTAAHSHEASGAASESGPDTANGVALGGVRGQGNALEPSDSASGFANNNPSAGSVAQEGGPDRAIGSLSVTVTGSGTTIEEGEDSAAGKAFGELVGAYPLDGRYVVSRAIDFYNRTPRFGDKDAQEKVFLTFDLSGDLVDDEKLIGPFTLTITNTAGVDTDPGAVLNGEPAFDIDCKRVIQPVQGGIPNCDYYFKVIVPTSNPFKVVSLSGLLHIRSI